MVFMEYNFTYVSEAITAITLPTLKEVICIDSHTLFDHYELSWTIGMTIFDIFAYFSHHYFTLQIRHFDYEKIPIRWFKFGQQ